MPVWNQDPLHRQYENELAEWWEGQRVIINSNPVGSWSADKLNGNGRPSDLTGNRSDMIILANASIETATNPHYVKFTTSNVSIGIALGFTGYSISGSLTIGGWFSVDSSQSGIKGLISKGLATFATASHSYGLVWTGNEPQFAIGNAAGTAYETITASNPPTIGDWFHVVGKFISGSEISIFINGIKTAVSTSITSTDNGINQIGVGQLGSGFGRLTAGKCQSAFINAHAIADIDIIAMYNNSKRIFGY